MVDRGCGDCRDRSNGFIMRRVIAIALAGASLAGCSGLSLDAFKPTPPSIQVQLESSPPGAEALTSLGPGCKTPCSVSISPPDDGFSVSYALDKYQSATVPVQVMRNPGDFSTPASTTIDPSPVFAELQRAVPAPKANRKCTASAKSIGGAAPAARLAVPRSANGPAVTGTPGPLIGRLLAARIADAADDA
jgi:hypothetical protein